MEKVGFLGPKGSFTEAAAKALVPSNERVPFRSIPDTMDAVSEGKVDHAMVPMENAIEGSVNITLDYFIHHQRMNMAAEIVAPIEQHLLVSNQNLTSWDEVKKVYSHPQAIAQCHQFLRKYLPEAEISYVNSTAAAAKYIQENPDESAAAIANNIAADAYGLKIAQRKINDYENNRTRFLLLTKGDKPFSNKLISEETTYKTSMMISLPSDFSGALHQVLSAFSWRKMNLTKIESRPTKTGLGNYFFIIDVAMKRDNVLIPSVCEELEALGCGVQVLGSYPCFSWEELQNIGEKVVETKST
ncbi:prephenate dehydratase [Salipaludibacillus neizhouensis]|uniref:Prephenate dehydratase n=1 Tax=Salipaludibacillus neizhouensis TaxID=885475 RepID=A0A3A9KFD3_9BACI|nr:prephenate dehydratase [Salipaludibacillus neizhouensis]RKL69370.1 prephenate dehydratase [Salipaludibacillus neizhouensis]